MVLQTGRVVRFDQVKGYGFLSSDLGGEDVFVHANDLLDEKYAFTPGTAVQFQVEEGDRGLKASAVRVVGGAAAASSRPSYPARGKATAAQSGDAADEDALCDVLSVPQFLREITEVLLDCAPSMTAGQIVQVRQGLVEHAVRHQWVEG